MPETTDNGWECDEGETVEAGLKIIRTFFLKFTDQFCMPAKEKQIN